MNQPSSAGGPAGELLPGERELWSGRPLRAPFRWTDIALPAWVLGVWAVLAVAWFHSHDSAVTTTGTVVVAFGAPVAVGIAYDGLVLRRRIRRDTVYTLTSLRILVTSGLRRRRTSSVYLDQIGELSARPGPDGAGDISLASGVVLSDVPAAAAVCAQITEARRAMLSGGVTVPWPGSPDTSARQFVPVPAAVTLAPGERTLWTGRAEGRVPVWFGPWDAYYTGFGVYAMAFATVLCVSAAASPGGGGAFIFVVFGVMGLYLAAGRLLHRWARIKRSVYVLTDQRIIACWQFSRPVVVQVRLDELGPPWIRGSLIVTARSADATSALAGPSMAGAWLGGPGLSAGLSRRVPQGRPRARLLSAQRQPEAGRPGGRGGPGILLWPAVAVPPPVLVGVADPAAVRDLMVAAQFAGGRTPSAPVT